MGEDCSDENLPTFWLDMCNEIKVKEDAQFVNLQLPENQEKNTGYNGRDVWNAMYKENCFEL